MASDLLTALTSTNQSQPPNSPFVWSGNGKKVSAAEAGRYRQLQEALLARNRNVAQNPWEGISQLSGALAAALWGNQASEAEEAGRAGIADALASGDWQSVIANDFAGEGERAIASTMWQRDHDQSLYERGRADKLSDWNLEQNSPHKLATLEAVMLENEARRRGLDAPPDPFAGTKVVNDQLVGMGEDGPMVIGDYRDAPATRDPAREQQIARLMETGVERNTAIGIVDGRYARDRHPVTGELQVVDMATGQPIYGGPTASTLPVPQQTEAPSGQSVMDPAVAAQFGTQFPAASQSFGLEGAATGLINTVGDAVGLGAPYPEVQQTQADFGVLRESLLNDIASAYGRQPPSWLLQEIRNLTPAAGNPFEGVGTAQSKLNAIGRHLTNELQLTEQALQRQLSPQNRQELEAKAAGLQAAIARVQGGIDAFGSQSKPAGEVDQDGWTTFPNGVRVRELP